MIFKAWVSSSFVSLVPSTSMRRAFLLFCLPPPMSLLVGSHHLSQGWPFLSLRVCPSTRLISPARWGVAAGDRSETTRRRPVWVTFLRQKDTDRLLMVVSDRSRAANPPSRTGTSPIKGSFEAAESWGSFDRSNPMSPNRKILVGKTHRKIFPSTNLKSCNGMNL